jgi:hypothetical protein
LTIMLLLQPFTMGAISNGSLDSTRMAVSGGLAPSSIERGMRPPYMATDARTKRSPGHRSWGAVLPVLAIASWAAVGVLGWLVIRLIRLL